MSCKYLVVTIVMCLLLPSISWSAQSSKVKKSISAKTTTPKQIHTDRTQSIQALTISEVTRRNFFPTLADACKDGTNNLVSIENNPNCEEKSSRSRMQSKFFDIMANYQCTKFDTDKYTYSTQDFTENCKTVSGQLNSLFQVFNEFTYAGGPDVFTAAKMKCTILFLAGAKKDMALNDSLKSIINSVKDDSTVDGKLTSLNALVDTFVDEDQDKIRSCNFKFDDNYNCVQNVQNDILKSIITKIALKPNPDESKKDQRKAQTIAMAAQPTGYYGSDKFVKTTPSLSDTSQFPAKKNEVPKLKVEEASLLEDKRSLLKSQIYSAFKDRDLNKFKDPNLNRTIASITSSQLDESQEKAFEVFKQFGFDTDKASDRFLEAVKNKSEEEIHKQFRELMIEMANKAYDQECKNSVIYNQEKLCQKINSNIEATNNLPNDVLMEKISNHVEDKQKQADGNNTYKNISANAIRKLAANPKNSKLDYAEFVNKLSYMENCTNRIGDKAFNNTDERNIYYDFNKVVLKIVEDQNKQELLKVKKMADDLFSNPQTAADRVYAASYASTKNQEEKQEFLNALGKNTVAQISGNNLSQNLSEVGQAKSTVNVNNSQNSGTSDSSFMDKSMLSNLDTSIKTNGQLNSATPTNNSYLSSQPIMGTNNTYVDRQNSFSESNSLQKKLEELTTKENSLKDKMNSEGTSTSSNKEMEGLQKQIEELRNQLADSKKDTVKAINQATIAKESSNKDLPSVASNNVPAYDFKKATYGTSNAKREDRNIDNTSADSSRFESGSIGSGSSGAGSQAVASRSISSVSGRSADSVKGFGLVLTKSGETTEDISKIADNPKDADILVLAEKSNGKPFIIRENGDLIQVQIKLDANGKPVYVNGKPELLKKKLSKEAQIQVAKNLDAIKEAKEVRDTVRLQQLNQLMLESK